MTRHLEKITDGDATALGRNEEVALRRSQLLLYARYVFFRVFLQCAAGMNGGITEDHKRRWLLVQLAPTILPPILTEKPDIFIIFTRLAGRASSEYLERSIYHESLIIRDLLPRNSTLFCVLDEAQTLTTGLDYFRSKPPTKARPFLRPIVAAWSRQLPNLIVSGTGISMQEVADVIGSLVAKEGGTETVTEIGAFDNENSQRAYLERYLPPGYLDTSEGKVIASRVGYWLRGRFVFNAAVCVC